MQKRINQRIVILIDFHSLRLVGTAQRWHLGIVLLAVLGDGLVVDMRLEALVEVVCACARNNDGEDEKENGQDGESGQRFPRRQVLFLAGRARDEHADELEKEVAECDEVEDDDNDHANDRLATDPESSGEEEEEGDDQGDGGEGGFELLGVLDDDKELDGEGKEEEEVELEHGNVNLVLMLAEARGK